MVNDLQFIFYNLQAVRKDAKKEKKIDHVVIDHALKIDHAVIYATHYNLLAVRKRYVQCK
jgi:hypothetical protein